MNEPSVIESTSPVDVDPSAKAYGVPVRIVPNGTVAGDVTATKTAVQSIDGKTPALGQATAGSSVPVVLPVAQESSLRDVSDRAGRLLGHTTVDSSALPSGAATSAAQTDGSQKTQVTALPAIPTGSNTIGAVTAPGAAALALDATLTGGNLKAIARGGAKGSTAEADVTSTAQGADHQGLDVSVRDSSGNPLPAMDVASRKAFVAVTDGTNTQVVKAASTAAAAGDPSAVVALSPNSPLPAGTNTIGAVTTPTTTPASLADVAVTTGAAALGSLAAGPSGILVTAHPNNGGVIRVSGSDVSATQGTPLRAGASYTFSVTNANVLHAVAESGTQTLCVTAV